MAMKGVKPHDSPAVPVSSYRQLSLISISVDFCRANHRRNREAVKAADPLNRVLYPPALGFQLRDYYEEVE